jgi:adenine-specific DNA-methyltransferase
MQCIPYRTGSHPGRISSRTETGRIAAGPHLATQVELAVCEHFNLLNHIIWRKPSILCLPGAKRNCRSPSNRYAYLDGAREAAGVTRKQIGQACGCQMSGHWFDRSQWSFSGETHYQTMNGLFGNTLKPCSQLKAEYKTIKEQRRHFAVTKHVPYANVWGFKPVQWYPGKHPCEK